MPWGTKQDRQGMTCEFQHLYENQHHQTTQKKLEATSTQNDRHHKNNRIQEHNVNRAPQNHKNPPH
jgi:hypothetical protein